MSTTGAEYLYNDQSFTPVLLLYTVVDPAYSVPVVAPTSPGVPIITPLLLKSKAVP